MSGFTAAQDAYEAWLRRRLAQQHMGDIVEADLARKHKLMRKNAFSFLRGSYWRWAEIVPAQCPALSTAPAVPAVGDTHIENFAAWPDAAGRLVWGVSDFDEATVMPYALDLVRLAVSAALAADTDDRAVLPRLAQALLAGYTQGLAQPGPIFVDDGLGWLRDALEPGEKQRARFWAKIDGWPREPAPARFRDTLAAHIPAVGMPFETARRVAGTGSLGRPRWIGVGDWQGERLVLEAKALVTSAWDLGRGRADAPIAAGGVASGRHRAPDPWYRVDGDIVVRRLSPDRGKIELEDHPELLLEPRMLNLMGRELAQLHLGAADWRAAIADDLARRDADWLAVAAVAMCDATRRDWEELRAN